VLLCFVPTGSQPAEVADEASGACVGLSDRASQLRLSALPRAIAEKVTPTAVAMVTPVAWVSLCHIILSMASK
jgi:hypothetical protein